jgi:hypothetical protein
MVHTGTRNETPTPTGGRNVTYTLTFEQIVENLNEYRPGRGLGHMLKLEAQIATGKFWKIMPGPHTAKKEEKARAQIIEDWTKRINEVFNTSCPEIDPMLVVEDPTYAVIWAAGKMLQDQKYPRD